MQPGLPLAPAPRSPLRGWPGAPRAGSSGGGGGHPEGFPAPQKPPPAPSQKVVRRMHPLPARPKGVTGGGGNGVRDGRGEPAAAFRGAPAPPAPSPRPRVGGGRRRLWGGKAPQKRRETFQAAAGAAPRDRHRLHRGGPAPGWGRGCPPTPPPLIKSHFGKLMPPPSPRPAAPSPRAGGGGAGGEERPRPRRPHRLPTAARPRRRRGSARSGPGARRGGPGGAGSGAAGPRRAEA